MNLKLLSKDIENIYEKLEFKQAISGKVLFVRGGNSNYVLDSDFSEIKKYFPDAKLETVLGAGHWVQAEKPAEFLAVVQNFIS
jgi:pimeloyl-ACP methyl ester carboxylesterase